MGENSTKSKEVASASGDQGGGEPGTHVAGLEVCVLALWVWDGVGGGAGEKVVAMEKAGEKWPRVVPLSTAGLNLMSRR